MSARIRPSSSSIVQESAEKCEVDHTWKKVNLGLPGPLMFMLITAQRPRTARDHPLLWAAGGRTVFC
jgi:hypothetical protein